MRAHNTIGATRTIQTVVSILSAQEELGEEFSEVAEEIMDIPYAFQYPVVYPVETNVGLIQ